MSKKNRNVTINNIGELNLEIDYDKLAEAIVKAQNMQRKALPKKKNFREKAMSFLNGALYAFVYIIAAMCVVQVWKDYSADNTGLFASIFSTIVFMCCGVYAFLCHQESFEDDGQAAQTHFNSNIALVALIVALIALLNGGGHCQ